MALDYCAKVVRIAETIERLETFAAGSKSVSKKPKFWFTSIWYKKFTPFVAHTKNNLDESKQNTWEERYFTPNRQNTNA